ncbi:unnamed protein product [Adineta ricciae]|uniref:Uncharacterized protein n=1 Tax=Adineta ricciae TaxID=249248 RepID=A0A816HAW2_ADIRI|nr:unnamed protein product [Adineta ricciae]
MKLKEDVHYQHLIDLGEEFKTFDPKYRNDRYFSLAHEAYVLLNIDLNAKGSHVPEDDAKASIQLYNKYLKNRNPSNLEQARKALLQAPTKIPVFRKFNGAYEGVCISAFNRGYCRCGKPLVSELHKQTNDKKRRNSDDDKEENSSTTTTTTKKMKVVNERSQS